MESEDEPFCKKYIRNLEGKSTPACFVACQESLQVKNLILLDLVIQKHYSRRVLGPGFTGTDCSCRKGQLLPAANPVLGGLNSARG